MRLTRDNMEREKQRKTDSQMGKLFKNLDALGSKDYGRKNDFTSFAMTNTAQIASGVKRMFSDAGNLWKSNLGSDARANKTIEKDTSTLNRLRMQKTAREQEAEDLESSGKPDEANKMRKSLETLNAEIEKTAKNLAKNTSDQYIKQMIKSDPELKKLEAEDKELMKKQIRDKMETSIIGNSNAKKDIAYRSASLQNGMTTADDSEDINARAEVRTVEGEEQTLATDGLSAPISVTSEPTT